VQAGVGLVQQGEEDEEKMKRDKRKKCFAKMENMSIN
jgi:hypothetical protein